jgi:hypothetical protein
VKRVLNSFLMTESMATYMGICLVGGIIWRRANRWGAVASLVVSLGTNFLLCHLEKQRFDYWSPNIFFIAFTAGILALIIFSLLTPPEPRAAVSMFFARLQTPSDLSPAAIQSESSSAEDRNRDRVDWKCLSEEPRREHAEQGQQLLLVNLFNLRRGSCGVSLFKAYSADLSGLAVGGFLTVVLVVGVWGLLRLL